MRTVQITLLEFKEPVTFVADEHPIVNDPDYCEVITTKPQLNYEYDGGKYHVTGNIGDTKDDLIELVKQTVSWDEWYYNNAEDKSFTDFNLTAPVVYDHEEYSSYPVDNIGNYVNNCKHDEKYNSVLAILQSIACNSVNVMVK